MAEDTSSALGVLFTKLAGDLDARQTAQREAQKTVIDRLLGSGEFDVVPRGKATDTDISLSTLPGLSLRRRDADTEISPNEKLKRLIDFGELASSQTEEGRFFPRKKTVGSKELIQQIIGEITAGFTGEEGGEAKQPKGGEGKAKAKKSAKPLLEAVSQLLVDFNPLVAAARKATGEGDAVSPTPAQVQAPTTTARPGEETKGLSTSEQDEFMEMFNGLSPEQQESALEDPKIREAFKEAQSGLSP